MNNGKSQTQTQTRSPWYEQAGQSALNRANTLSTRPYEGYDAERVAGLSSNEKEAYGAAGGLGAKLQPYQDRLKGGFSAENLKQFQNPFVDQVLGKQRRVIGEEYGRQAGVLARNESAMNAFRSGRSDLARSRLEANRATALGDAEASGQKAAFDAAMDANFRQGSQDISAMGATANAESQRINALSSTGAAERSVRQAQDDFNYGQFIERRDWDVNNLNNLISAISGVSGTAGTTSTTTGKEGTNWGGIIGSMASLVGKGMESGLFDGMLGKGAETALNSGATSAATSAATGSAGGALDAWAATGATDAITGATAPTLAPIASEGAGALASAGAGAGAGLGSLGGGAFDAWLAGGATDAIAGAAAPTLAPIAGQGAGALASGGAASGGAAASTGGAMGMNLATLGPVGAAIAAALILRNQPTGGNSRGSGTTNPYASSGFSDTGYGTYEMPDWNDPSVQAIDPNSGLRWEHDNRVTTYFNQDGSVAYRIRHQLDGTQTLEEV